MLSFKNVSLAKPTDDRRPKLGQDDVLVDLDTMRKKHADKAQKAVIYRAGTAPAWQNEEDEDSDDDLLKRAHKGKVAEPEIVSTGPRRIQEATVVTGGVGKSDDTEGEGDVKVKVELGAPAELPAGLDLASLEVPDAESSSEEEEEEEEDDSRSRRRAMIKARLKAKMEKEAEEQAKAKEQGGDDDDDHDDDDDDDSDDDDDDDSESESESDFDDDYGLSAARLLKPVFVSRKERETVEERKRLEEEDRQIEKDKQRRKKEMEKEATQWVIEEVKAEEEAAQKNLDGEVDVADMPPDDDGVDEEKELAEWKIRELKRIKRDKELREEEEKEAAQLVRRRAMTDADIKAENRMKDLGKKEEDRGQYRFLQKYYHPGAFFADDQLDRDYAAPTGEDRHTDKTLLPEILQVKKFGLKGRTKYTHLVDQDTTNADNNPWAKAAENPDLPQRRMAGTGSTARPSKRLKK